MAKHGKGRKGKRIDMTGCPRCGARLTRVSGLTVCINGHAASVFTGSYGWPDERPRSLGHVLPVTEGDIDNPSGSVKFPAGQRNQPLNLKDRK